MSTVDVLDRFGTLAMVRFVGAVVAVLVLHLLRIPLVVAAGVLEGVIRRADGYAVAQANAHPARPINHFYASGKESRR